MLNAKRTVGPTLSTMPKSFIFAILLLSSISCLSFAYTLRGNLVSSSIRNNRVQNKKHYYPARATKALRLMNDDGITLIITSAEEISNLSIIRPSLNIFFDTLNILFIIRTVLSWYPKTDLKKFPYSAVVWPTEPLLEPVRGLVPPAFGVDISSIVWIMLLSFFREVLTGQQGILTLLERS